jgi:hypothetical protein
VIIYSPENFKHWGTICDGTVENGFIFLAQYFSIPPKVMSSFMDQVCQDWNEAKVNAKKIGCFTEACPNYEVVYIQWSECDLLNGKSITSKGDWITGHPEIFTFI